MTRWRSTTRGPSGHRPQVPACWRSPAQPHAQCRVGCLGQPMRCDAVAIGTRAWNVGASRAERAQASLGLVIGRSRRYRLNPHHTDEITRFVRGTLGCQCPDEVFQSIVIGQERTADHGEPFTRLLVGDRLLIYILPTSSMPRHPTPSRLWPDKVGSSVTPRVTTASDWSSPHATLRPNPPPHGRCSTPLSATTTKRTCTSWRAVRFQSPSESSDSRRPTPDSERSFNRCAGHAAVNGRGILGHDIRIDCRRDFSGVQHRHRRRSVQRRPHPTPPRITRNPAPGIRHGREVCGAVR